MRKYGKYCQYCQLSFSSEIEVPQLGSAQLGTLIARLISSWKIPARPHHYYLFNNLCNQGILARLKIMYVSTFLTE
jgi:hypothetical protein